MYGTESSYHENENATGFIKYYKGREYAFAALLPKDGVTLTELTESLSGESLHKLLQNPVDLSFYTSIPKFETGYDVEMSDILKGMGMTDAFYPDLVNFKDIGSSTGENFFISSVLHKTFLTMGEKGTKAGAATVIGMSNGGAEPEEAKEVHLDRQFVYMLIDTKNCVPLFIGSMTDPSA